MDEPKKRRARRGQRKHKQIQLDPSDLPGWDFDHPDRGMGYTFGQRHDDPDFAAEFRGDWRDDDPPDNY